MTRHGLTTLLMLALLGGCDDGDPSEDAGSRPDTGPPRGDAGSEMDAGTSGDEDAGPGDSGGGDAGPGDGGPPASSCCTEAAWDVAEGVAPDADCVPWIESLVGVTASPGLGAAGVTFATTDAAENQFYLHDDGTIAAADRVQIRFRMRSVSSSSPAAWRAGAGVVFAFGPSREKNALYIADGEIFLLSAENVRGMSASVATSDAMHDYVIDIDRSTGDVAVSYDGTPTLTGSLFVTPSDTTTDRIGWGEISSVASGESVWESFEHDAWVGCHRPAWDVADAVLPDVACPPWTPTDTAAADPSLSSAGVTFVTAADAENLGYSQTMVDGGNLVRIAFRMRSVSSISAAPWRAGAGVGFVFGTSMEKNSLYIGDGEIFLLSAENTQGASATVPTSDAMHDYVIEVDRTTGTVDVSYDGTPTLTGSLFITPTDTTTDRISWGDITLVAHGESTWESFTHDAYDGCPAP